MADEEKTIEKETCEFCEESFPKSELKEHYTVTYDQTTIIGQSVSIVTRARTYVMTNQL